MRTIIQRVNYAKVVINNQLHSEIKAGLLVLLGIEENDTCEDAIWLAKKVVNLRIFDDNNGLMNLSVKDIDGEIMIISQFTLHALTKKGNRPSYIKAAKPEVAIPLYNLFIEEVKKELGKKVETGIFGARMMITLENNGPVTIFIDSKNKE
ncbi:MAG: D-aminoacyl-tRNA deacylase [Bacteroidales bacterium]|nr:D-aminoacyl-tRNA deacylase [Bacteroidales bacterium]